MENKKNYTPIIITFGIIIFVALVGVYYIGKSSNNQTQNNQIPAETSAQTPVTQSPQTKAQNQTTTNNNNFATNSENGLACKKIANEAATMEQSKSGDAISVVKSHFSQTFNKCFYELQDLNVVLGSVQTEIRFAPDDEQMAECNNQLPLKNDSTPLCGQHNVGIITEQAFNQLENTYFNN